MTTLDNQRHIIDDCLVPAVVKADIFEADAAVGDQQLTGIGCVAQQDRLVQHVHGILDDAEIAHQPVELCHHTAEQDAQTQHKRKGEGHLADADLSLKPQVDRDIAEGGDHARQFV